MFSYAYLYRFHGENSFADRVELAAFNALPAGVSEDCKLSEPGDWRPCC